MPDADEARWLADESRRLGVVLSPQQARTLVALADLLQEAAWRINLTAIRDRPSILVKHHLDCLAAAALVDPRDEGPAVDVGSGAGFPGLPLAVARPALAVALVESVRKKAAFLERAVRELGLANAAVVNERAEALARDPRWRERARWAFARALGSLAVSVELCAPLVELGGRVVVMKGPGVAEEWEAGLAHARRGGLELVDRGEVTLPGGLRRVLVVLEKRRPSPAAWPRRPGRAGRPDGDGPVGGGRDRPEKEGVPGPTKERGEAAAGPLSAGGGAT